MEPINKTRAITAFSLSLFLISAFNVLAEGVDYVMLAPIPGITKPGTNMTNTAVFLPALFKMAIGLASGLAVIMLLYGGIQYMTTDAWGSKQTAKDTIKNAIVGLMLTLSAYLIVYTINPKMLDFNLKIQQFRPKENLNIGGVTGGDTSSAPIGGSETTGGNCADCVNIGVPAKTAAQNGCRGTGLCKISPIMNSKLVDLHKKSPLYVTEAYPPTVKHDDPCHAAGTCVDATISRNSAANIINFIKNADGSGLNAKFEVTSPNRYAELTKAGVPSNYIMTNYSATGEHFHIKLK